VAPDAHGPLVSCETLSQHLDDPTWVVVDCRYDLADLEKGVREYGKAHMPGAFFADTGRDLSGPVGDGRKGRHPLPIPGAFQRFAGSLGIVEGTKVVCYDDQAGQWASRLWWLLRHYGHQNVAVLDGGLTRWKALNLPLRSGHENARKAVAFTGIPGQMPTIDATTIEAGLGQSAGTWQLVDVRAGERYRGEVEPIDKRAGHIPGAVSLPFGGNMASGMLFLKPEELRARFEGALGVQEAGRVACYCGSGVTGTHDVLAMEVAGMGTPALYPGSWSEWSWPDAERPIVAGPADKGPPKKTEGLPKKA
jgi:thiosulfate/3-mercaptopyruvate sulfurtransferase